MKQRMRKYSKSVRIICLVLFLLLCGHVSLKAEIKMANNNLNKTLDLHAMSIKAEEFRMNDLFAPLDTYFGDLTGYAAYCPLCSGFLGCNSQDVRDGRTTHYDKDYGNVRIVASSRSLPCGSIIQFNLPSVSSQKITAIVLDRGVLGTDIDLLMETEADAFRKVGRRKISYDILRFGYKR